MLDIQEYLLLKGVEAVAIHGSKSGSKDIIPGSEADLSSARRKRIRHQVLQEWGKRRHGSLRCRLKGS